MKDERIHTPMQERIPETSISRADDLKNERIPVYAQKSLTYSKQDPNFRYRMVNDSPGKIERFKLAGWEIVKGTVSDTYSGKGRKEVDDRGSAVRTRVNPNQEHQFGILMRIPIKFYDEDQLVKEQRREEREAEIDKKGDLKKARILGPRANINK